MAIAALDHADGDPDYEPGGDDEPLRADGDSDDCAWIEWDTMRGSQKRGPNIIQRHEDDEDDEDDDPAGGNVEDEGEADTAEDSFSIPGHFLTRGSEGAGCPIADPGGCQHDGREQEDGY